MIDPYDLSRCTGWTVLEAGLFGEEQDIVVAMGLCISVLLFVSWERPSSTIRFLISRLSRREKTFVVRQSCIVC